MEKYIRQAKELGMIDAKLITPNEIYFDIRAILKCRWGCEEFSENNIRCRTRDITFDQSKAMVNNYKNVLFIHSHDRTELSKALLEIESSAFLDGYYFAFVLRYCKLCKECVNVKGKSCPTPEKVRPCEGAFGIDVYKTARNLGFPCEVLQNRNDTQNRYGFLLID